MWVPNGRLGLLVASDNVPVIIEANGDREINLLQVCGGLLADPMIRRFYEVTAGVWLRCNRGVAFRTPGSSQRAWRVEPQQSADLPLLRTSPEHWGAAGTTHQPRTGSQDL
jgi:hypothetical protein